MNAPDLRHDLEVSRVWRALDLDPRDQFDQFLRDLVENHETVYGRDASADPTEEQLSEFSETIRSLATRYINQPQWHTPLLTHYLLVDILENQQLCLLWASKWGIYSEWSLRRSLPSPYRTFVPPLMSLIIFAALVLGLFWLVNRGDFVLAALLSLGICYFYAIEKPLVWWRRRKHRKHFAMGAALLTTPLYEIKSSNYDPETINRRLQGLEQKDLQVASIVFALLKLHPRTQQSLVDASRGT